ncbi:MAG TPA: VWA domain-containing protein [Conexibacter sp.]|nr:VWA domain-containing protein [Conexibacter sp.]
MSFGAPLGLLALALVPLALALHGASRRRARRYAVRFPAAATLARAAGGTPAWRRWAPLALLLAAIAALALALAKPQKTVAVPIERASIMLVTDHSRSMMADDVDPTRLDAAKRAARTFLDELPAAVRVGVTTFSDVPDQTQAPTTDHALVRRMVDAQVADGGTATGDALQVALEALAREPRGADGRRPPSAIVLLSDGATTIGRDPVGVAQLARRQRVPIYTVALGTRDATVPNPGFGPPLIPVPPDPATLKRIADASGGHAYSAQDDQTLSTIYKTLGSQLGTRTAKREITAAFAIGGLVLLLGAAAASTRWAGRVP